MKWDQDRDLIALDEIVMDDMLQVRSKVDRATVGKYADAMLAGAEFPPVKVAKVGNALILVDGWHRMGAARRNDAKEILAIVAPMSREEAVWEAARANLTHGLPLKRGDRREVFRAYVRAGQHMRGRKLKSYRDIAAELDGLAGHTTIRGWMEKDFKSIFRRMGGGPRYGNSEAGPPKIDHEAGFRRQAEEALDAALMFTDLLKEPGNRYAMIEKTKRVLEEMKKKPHEKAEAEVEEDDF